MQNLRNYHQSTSRDWVVNFRGVRTSVFVARVRYCALSTALQETYLVAAGPHEELL